MTRRDRRRWDEKWLAIGSQLEEPHVLLRRHRHLLVGGEALDLACGRGQNSLFLADAGYNVLGVDISKVALAIGQQAAEERGLSNQVCFKQVDLDLWIPPENGFDLIAVFRFLNRALFPALKNGLRPGGLVFYSTRNRGLFDREPESNPDYLVEKGELLNLFSGWEVILTSDEAVDSSLVARKPAGSHNLEH